MVEGRRQQARAIKRPLRRIRTNIWPYDRKKDRHHHDHQTEHKTLAALREDDE
jgi:hypothetical protein